MEEFVLPAKEGDNLTKKTPTEVHGKVRNQRCPGRPKVTKHIFSF